MATIRLQPDSELTEPASKKPRLDAGNSTTAPNNKKTFKKTQRKGKKGKNDLPVPCSPEDVLWRDIIAILGQEAVDKALEDGTEYDSPFSFKQEVEVVVKDISSSGDGLAILAGEGSTRPWVVVVPFSLPGETILARVYRQHRLHSVADFVRVVTPNTDLRDDSLVRCKYFTQCAGCQYQMLSYDTQLDYKRNVVVKAYKHYSDLDPSVIPSIGSTIASPLQYGYRTKITPHFDAPPKKAPKINAGDDVPEWLKIGFNKVGTRHVMDIEDCPIATPVINEAYNPLRKQIQSTISTYKKGVSLLLRDSLEINSTPTVSASETDVTPLPIAAASVKPENHVCITNHKTTVRERVGDITFEYPGGSFFQNNNSVLVPLTSYVREAIFQPDSIKPTHLVDAYCGSGLFALTLSSSFTHVSGIELSTASIASATRSLSLNVDAGTIPPSTDISFRSGDASDIFSTVSDYPRNLSALIIDPPRKGCDDKFIEQLIVFRCAVVVYVSCNVHTQARDIGSILRRSEEEDEKEKQASGEGKGRYKLESLRGFDLFPQTAHVESVAVLRLN